MNKQKKNNVVKFPDTKVSEQEKEIEAILFASNIPLDLETIENKVSKLGYHNRSIIKKGDKY